MMDNGEMESQKAKVFNISQVLESMKGNSLMDLNTVKVK
jgi:hypothetical protein